MKRKLLSAATAIGLILLLWEGAAVLLGIPKYLLARPSDILREIASRPDFYRQHVLTTAFESVGGFSIGIILACIGAVIGLHSPFWRRVIFSSSIGIEAIPMVALAPILIVWLGIGPWPKIVVSAILVFYPCLFNFVRGLEAVPRETLDVFRSFGATRAQLLLKVRVFFAVPYVFIGLKTGTTLSVVGAIIGEFSGADKGLGFVILSSLYRIETTAMFSSILLSVVLSLLLFVAVSGIARIAEAKVHLHAAG